MFIGQFMPWIDEELLGPVRLQPYVWSFLALAVPNALVTGALLALLAALTRSILWVYIGVLGFLVLYIVTGVMLVDIDNVWVAVLAEPMGVRAISRLTRYWSAEERNAGVPAFVGYLLANRLLWSTIAVGLLAATFALFRTDRAGTGKAWFGKRVAEATPARVARPQAQVPAVMPQFGAATTWRQVLRQAAFDTAGVFRGVPFLVLLAFAMVNFIPSAVLTESMFGTPIHPVTSQMVEALQSSYSWLLAFIVMFYAGELVFRERGVRIAEITDAMPVPDWVPLVAKFLALVAVIMAFQAIGALAAMAVQLAKGHFDLQPLLYVKMLAVGSVFYLLAGVLALCLQVYVNSKFAGYAFLIAVILAPAALSAVGFDHPLYTFGAWENAPHSDMNGYGHFLAKQFWMQGYWAAMFTAAMLLATAFWVRGTGASPKQRWTLARTRLRGPLGVGLGAATAATLAIGGYLFWNYNIRNDYLTGDDQLDVQARYEKQYKRYESLPQPRIVAADIAVDLRPEDATARIDGRLRVKNRHAVPITDVHVVMADDGTLKAIDFGGQALVKHDAELGYRIYRLATPLAPGEERAVTFRVQLAPNGYAASPADTRIVGNGSFLNNRAFPSFGYAADAEIVDRAERKKRGLGEPRRMPKLEDKAARANNYVTYEADWLDFATTVCTAPEQVALAPGYLKREFAKDGRRCFRYEMDRPMLNFYAYLSARWEVTRGQYTSADGRRIPIEVYHHPRHDWNVARMIEAVQHSLAYYEKGFSPYQHQQVRIVEFPAFAASSKFAQAFANTIPYSESIGFIADLSDPDELDYVYYVTAHEVAHQWWAHQVIGANVQGATMLSESLSQYSALMVMEQEYGRAHMRQFLRRELDGYLAGRGGERLEELPLARNENQQYIHYEKASLVLYRLREELGEDAVNRALRKFIAAHAYQEPPYPTSLDLLAFIRAEAGPEQQALVTDLFEKIAFYDNRLEGATAKKRADGKYEVTLDMHAAKRYVDGKGKETAGALDDWIEVGVFASGPSGKERDEKVLYLQRHRVTQAEPTLTVVVDAAPYEAGFDPYNKLIDRVPADNRRKVEM
jgi:ABC-2 type transport system permease protein